MNDHPHIHETHPEIVKRLKRADGHLRSVIEMLEPAAIAWTSPSSSTRSKAITQAKKTLIQDHLDHCLDEVLASLPRDQRRSIDDFKDIIKYL